MRRNVFRRGSSRNRQERISKHRHAGASRGAEIEKSNCSLILRYNVIFDHAWKAKQKKKVMTLANTVGSFQTSSESIIPMRIALGSPKRQKTATGGFAWSH
jgi:hypothetical protein